MKPITLPLTDTQVAAIRAAGNVAVLVGRASWPDNHLGEFVLRLLPCSVQQGNDAVRVATGEARAVKVSKLH